jgi:hypothetical protein
MPVTNGAPNGATKTTMFSQPNYSGPPPTEGVAHSQPPSQESPPKGPGGSLLPYNNSIFTEPSPQPSIPQGYTAQSWASQQQIYNALGIKPQSSNPSQSGYVAGYGSSSPAQRSPVQSTSSQPVSLKITQSPATTGVNQLPSWIASELQSGKISSYTNSQTGETWYAPHTINNSNSIWLANGNGFQGPVQSYNGQLYINAGGSIIPVTTTSQTTITENGQTSYSGPSATAPHITFTADGRFTGLQNVPETSFPAAELTNYQTFTTPSGESVSLPTSLQDGSIIINGKWSPNQDGTYSFNPSSYQLSNEATTITLTNPTLSELESYGIKRSKAEQLLQGLTTATISIDPTKGTISLSGQYNPPTLTQTELNNIINSGVLQPSILSQMNNAQITIDGKTYSTQQLDALYNSLYNQEYTLPTPQAFWNVAGTGLSNEYASAPVTTPTFTTASIPTTGSPTIVLPQGWSVNPKTGDLTIKGNPNNGAPTAQQAVQYANAYADYLNWYQSNPQPSSTSTETSPPSTPNWYKILLTTPSGGIATASLAALEYAPMVTTTTASQTPLQGVESWFGQNVVNPVETALAPAGVALNNYVAKPFEQYVASPAEQFEQGVLKTPLPSAQQLSGLPLLLSANPSLFPYLYSQILPESPTPTTQSQQPITIDSLLNSAATSGSSHSMV